MNIDRAVLGLEPFEFVSVGDALVHCDIVPGLQHLQLAAKREGFDLKVVSGYRSFERQLTIWNAKASGKRAVFDDNARILDVTRCSATELMFAILRWSALPGGSRHHWGSDIDVVDANAVSADYRVQLTVAETQGDGPFAPMHAWLNRYFDDPNNTDFFRPYRFDKGGIAPEPWHLSHRTLAAALQKSLDPNSLQRVIAQTDILLKDQILHHFDDIFNRFVWVDWALYSARGEKC